MNPLTTRERVRTTLKAQMWVIVAKQTDDVLFAMLEQRPQARVKKLVLDVLTLRIELSLEKIG